MLLRKQYRNVRYMPTDISGVSGLCGVAAALRVFAVFAGVGGFAVLAWRWARDG